MDFAERCVSLHLEHLAVSKPLFFYLRLVRSIAGAKIDSSSAVLSNPSDATAATTRLVTEMAG